MPAYLTLEGEKQGKIEGACEQSGREGTLLVQAFDHEVRIPTDIQTGLAAGKRVHGPYKVCVEVDKALPLMFQSLCTGEHLKKVEIKLFRIAKTGAEEHYFTTTLEDAVIVSIKPYMPNCLDKSMGSFGHMVEVAFTYRKCIWRHECDKKESQDDWKVPAK
jgi:type VI secretion system secreted protein Hcp